VFFALLALALAVASPTPSMQPAPATPSQIVAAALEKLRDHMDVANASMGEDGALDLGDSENRKLIDYYPHRAVLLLEPDVSPPRLTPYRVEAPEPPVPAPPARRVRTPKPAADEFSTLPESGFLKRRH